MPDIFKFIWIGVLIIVTVIAIKQSFDTSKREDKIKREIKNIKNK
jgi:hypothetical protein